MTREARSQFAILGMFTLGPMTGYDLRRQIEQTIGYFWHESFGQLYPTLAQLERDGLVSARPRARGARERTLYTITKKGRANLRAWLAKRPMRHVERNELLMKIFFGTEIGATTVMAHVEESRADAEARLRDVRQAGTVVAKHMTDQPSYDYYWATLRNGELGLEAHIRWCDEVLARLKLRDA